MKYQIDCSGPSHGGGDALTGCHGCAFWFRWFTSSRILRAIAGLLLAFTTLLVISTPASGAQIADGEVTETILNTEGAEPHDRPYSLQATAAAGAITLTWQDPETHASHGLYHILRHRPELGETQPRVHARYTYIDNRTFTDSAVEPGVLYVYAVKAVKDLGGFLGPSSASVEVRMPPVESAEAVVHTNTPLTGLPSIAGTDAVAVPLTASFEDVPSEHAGPDGEWVVFKVRFSHEPRVSYTVLRDLSFDVTDGVVRKARRVNGRNDLREIHVEPAGYGDVVLTLPGNRACGTEGAICTADERALVNTETATIPGPAALAVADTQAEEGTDATIDFTVTLDRPAAATVSVDYATADGTATAGADYTAASGTLTFAAGETARTVAVDIIDDAAEDDGETLKLLLSNPSGARLTDSEAVGTIHNTETQDVPADTTTMATVAVGGSVNGEFESVDDRDWYAVPLVAGTIYQIDLVGSDRGDRTYLHGIHDAQGAFIPGTRIDDRRRCWGWCHKSRLYFTPQTTATYHIAAGTDLSAPSGGRYSLAVTQTLPSFSVADARAPEGTNATVDFIVKMDLAAAGTVTVAYATEDGIAEAGSDYTAASGTLTFAAGETSKTVAVGIISDSVSDGGETFKFLLSNPSGARLADAMAVGTIDNAGSGDVPGDTTTTATVAVGGSVRSEIEVRHDQDWFAVSFVEGTIYKIDIKGTDHGYGTLRDPYLHGIYDADGELIPDTTNNNNGWPDDSRLYFKAQTTGVHYIAAGHYRGGPPEAWTGTYILMVTGSIDDFPEDISTTGTVAVGGSATGMVQYAYDRDWFKVVLDADVTYRIDLIGDPDDPHWLTSPGEGALQDSYLYGVHDAQGNRIAGSTNDNGGVGANSRVFFKAPASATYYIAAGAWDGFSESFPPFVGPYTLKVVVEQASLDVADASVREAEGAKLSFRVTLNGPVSETVTVDYATADGTATAGADYTAASGTLTFQVGKTEKTVEVTVLDDAHNEGSETLTLSLSNAAGARIADGTATGTIVNSDPIPQAWLARFGRTVADHVVDAITERLDGSSGGGSQVTLGGQRIPLDGVLNGTSPSGTAGRDTGQNGAADTLGAFTDRTSGDGVGAGWVNWGAGGGEDAAKGPILRTLSERELLLRSSFVLGSGGDTGTAWTAWGRATAARFDGEADDLSVDGDVTTLTLGADAARGRWLGGVALAHSAGEGGFRDHADTDYVSRGAGSLESSLTGVHPFLRFRASERLSLWSVLGYGAGDLTLAVNAVGNQPRKTWKTDTEMWMAAAGARGVLLSAPSTGGFELAARGDVRLVRMRSEAVSGSDGSGNLAASDAQTSRLRFMLEGSHRIALEGGQTLMPSLEVALRHDGGDAETGTGVEVGVGVSYADPALGLTVEGKARGLLAHEDTDYREWGASGSVRIDPGAAGRGLALSLSPAWGADSGGAERLWSARDARALAANDAFEPAGRLAAEAGYGLAAFGGRGLMTPFAGLSLSEAGNRTWRTGVRWTLGPEVTFGVEGARREAGNDNAPDHGIQLRATFKW